MYGTDAGRPRHRVRAGLMIGGATVSAMVLLTGCSSGSDGEDKPEEGSGGGQPTQSDAPFWVNPDGRASAALAKAKSEGNDEESALIQKIAEQPAGEWIKPEEAESQTREITDAAEKAGTSPVLVAYNIPHRDCGQYSQGGAKNADEYRAFIDGIAKGIGDREASVIIEPDALPHIMQDGCVPPAMHEEQYTLINEAVTKLKDLGNTKVYIDAGNPHWIRDAGGMVEPLKKAGIDKADGFSLNVSNYQTTQENIEYGEKLSSMVGDKQFVIDTSRNGNGPMEGEETEESWCNPPGRALGEAPTTDTDSALVDAYLWIKRPGESDGTCKGGPEAGEWFQDYALELVRNSDEG